MANPKTTNKALLTEAQAYCGIAREAAAIMAERERCVKIVEAELESYATEAGEILAVRHILDKIRSGEHA